MPLGAMVAYDLLPGQQRNVDDVLSALIADGVDGIFGVFKTEGVRRHQLQWEAMRGELLHRQLASAIAVTASGLDRDVFYGHLADWEIRKIRHFSLNQQRAALAL